MKKPLIALIPKQDTRTGRWGIDPDYMIAVANAGGIGVMLPLTVRPDSLRQIARQFDGFLFTGGHDLDPALYGQERSPLCGKVVSKRDTMEMELLKAVLELDKPVLGICRGLQTLNVALGGTLCQDIPTQRPSEITHKVTEPPLNRYVHEIRVSPELPFGQLPLTLEVNSRHHQCVCRLAPGLKVRATAPDGVIEAVYLPEKRFVRAVQWHPENFRNELTRVIFQEFLEAAAE